MDKHDDLLEAALNAVGAIESNSSAKKEPAASEQKSFISPPVPQNKLHAGNSLTLPSDLLDDDDDDFDLTPDDISDEEDVELDIDLSVSSLGLADAQDVPEVDGISSIGVISLEGLMGDASSDIPEELSSAGAPEQETAEGTAEAVEAVVGDDFAQKYQELSAQLEELTGKYNEVKAENDQLHIIQKQFNDKLIRVTADFDNYRKRVARDQDLMRHQAEERIVMGFLPIMDNLERALVHSKQQNDFEQLVQGVEMTGKLYLGVLAKLGCVPFGSLGETFDPVYHDVLSRVIDSEKPHNSIVQEHLRGYMMHDRVLRPALVVVSQHEEEPQGE